MTLYLVLQQPDASDEPKYDLLTRDAFEKWSKSIPGEDLAFRYLAEIPLSAETIAAIKAS